MTEVKKLAGKIEGLLFAAGEAVSLRELETALQAPPEMLMQALEMLEALYKCPERGLRLVQIHSTWQLATKPEYYDSIEAFLGRQPPSSLSSAALETLSIIAYKQPVSRVEIDNLRGVSSNSSVQKLLSKGLIKEAGRMDAPGRPILYKTTDAFLKAVNLKSLKDLPELSQFSEGEQQRIEIRNEGGESL